MSLPEVALDHYRDRQLFVSGAAQVAARMWSEVDEARIVESWARQVPELTAVVSGAQLGAARPAESYLDEVAGWQDLEPNVEGLVDPAAFAGQAADGRGLVELLMSPAFQAAQVVVGGLMSPSRAVAFGAQRLDVIARTEVADAGRLADQVALTAHREFPGYVRIAVGKSCSRCLILAGKRYRWNQGFRRHPRCDCIHLPAAVAQAGGLLQNPRAAYNAMTVRERQRAGWSLADQRAIADGADIMSVTNAHRGIYVGGRKFTRDSTTRRGAGRRLGAERGRPAQRLTPEQIYREAGDDRAEAIRLLERHGYLRARVPAAARERVDLAASLFGGRRAATPAPSAGPPVRRRLARAADIPALEREFGRDAARLTGRNIEADFAGQAVETARDHAEGVLRVLERYPDAPLRRLTWYQDVRASYARGGDGRIEFNLRYAAAGAREQYLEALSGDLAHRWHPQGACNPAGIAAHEMAHVIDDAVGRRCHAAVDELLTRRAAEQGISRAELVTLDISRYPAHKIGRPEELDEVIGDAFADVIMNGKAASALSREIVGLLEAEYRRAGFQVGREGALRFSTAADDAARVRQVAIDTARQRAQTLIEAQQLVADGASARALAHRAGELRKAFARGRPPVAVERLLKAMEAGDPAAVEVAIAAAARGLRLTRLETPGGITRFDRGAHRTVGRDLPAGTQVKVISPGYSVTIKGERVVLERPVVQEADALTVAKARQAQIDDVRRTADLVAEVDELLGLAAGKAEMRIRIEQSAARLKTPDAVRDAILKAVATGDPAAVRRVLATARRRARLKAVGAAGKTAKFDPKVHRSLGERPKPGQKVEIVRPGHTATLRSGEVVQLDRAVVEIVDEPLQVEFPSRAARTIQEIMDEFGPRLERLGYGFEHDLARRQFASELREAVGRAVDGRYGDLIAAVDNVSVLPGGAFLAFSGVVRDLDGRRVGHFSRVVSVADRDAGTLKVEHVLLQLSRRVQGSGFAERFNRNLYDWYRRSGLKYVEVHANIDVGGYTWATQGFDFLNARAANSFLREAREKIDRAIRRTPKGMTREQIRELDAYIARIESGEITANAPDIARFGRQPGQGGRGSLWAGKWLMLKSDWRGVLFL